MPRTALDDITEFGFSEGRLRRASTLLGRLLPARTHPLAGAVTEYAGVAGHPLAYNAAACAVVASVGREISPSQLGMVLITNGFASATSNAAVVQPDLSGWQPEPGVRADGWLRPFREWLVAERGGRVVPPSDAEARAAWAAAVVNAANGGELYRVGGLFALTGEWVSNRKYKFHQEDCPKCGASMEGDPDSGRCNSCGTKWGKEVTTDSRKEAVDNAQTRDKNGRWARQGALAALVKDHKERGDTEGAFALGVALGNVKGNDHLGDDAHHKLTARRLFSVYTDAVRLKKSKAQAAAEHALETVAGAERIGQAGTTVPFHPIHHEADTSASTGQPVHVKAHGYRLTDGDKEYILGKAKVSTTLVGNKAGGAPKRYNPMQPRDANGRWTNVPHAGGVTVLKALGGSTGAKLVVDEHGKKWVMKTGPSKEHLVNESIADEAYRRLGLNVPQGGLRVEPDGTVTKFTQFLPGAKTLKDWEQGKTPQQVADVHEQIAKHFAADALMGNWDVVGATKDNIMVDMDGKVWRVDNGGALEYRAQGAKKKPGEFDGTVKELESMVNPVTNPSGAAVFGTLTPVQIKQQVAELGTADKAKFLAAFASNPALQATMAARWDSLHQQVGAMPGGALAKHQLPSGVNPAQFLFDQGVGTQFGKLTYKAQVAGASLADLDAMVSQGYLAKTGLVSYTVLKLPDPFEGFQAPEPAKPGAAPVQPGGLLAPPVTKPQPGGMFSGVSAKDIPGWGHLHGLPEGKVSYGAVLYRKNKDTGEVEVLLRKPTGNYDGYHWTFPKGGHTEADPLSTAKKEVAEETGHEFHPTGHLYDTFKSPDGKENAYFIGEVAGKRDNAKLDGETEALKWVPVHQAGQLIGRGTNAEGVVRDLNVLSAFGKSMGVDVVPKPASATPVSPPPLPVGAKVVDRLHTAGGLYHHLSKKGGLTPLALKKIAFSNPNGIQSGVVYSPKSAKEQLAKMLPPGTVIKTKAITEEDVAGYTIPPPPSKVVTTAVPISPPPPVSPPTYKVPDTITSKVKTKGLSFAAAETVGIVDKLKNEGKLTGATLKAETDKLTVEETHEFFQHHGIDDYTKHPVGTFDALASDIIKGNKGTPKPGGVDLTKDYTPGSGEHTIKTIASQVSATATKSGVISDVAAHVASLSPEYKGQLKAHLGIPKGSSGTNEKTLQAVLASLPDTHPAQDKATYTPPTPTPTPTPAGPGTAGSGVKAKAGPVAKGVFVKPTKTMSVDGVHAILKADEGAKVSSKPINAVPVSVVAGYAFHQVDEAHLPDFAKDSPPLASGGTQKIPHTYHNVDATDAGEWRNKLTADEQHAISKWKGSSTKIREAYYEALKSGEPMPERMNHIMSAVQKMPPQPGVYYRGIHGDYANELLTEAHKALATGTNGWMYDTAPHGMTTNPYYAASYFGSGQLMLRIHSKSARPMRDIAGFEGEDEAVGVPGARYRVKAIHTNTTVEWDSNPTIGQKSGKQKMQHIIEMEEI